MASIGFCRPAFPGLAVLVSVAIFLCIGPAVADPNVRKQSPENLPVAITIDAENLIELYQSVPGLKIIDSRLAEDHGPGFIETSLNLPLAQTGCAELEAMAGNKDQAIVFYCNGSAADASIKAIQIAASCGYQRLFWFRGGFAEWVDKDYPYLIE